MSLPLISPEACWYFGDIGREKTDQILSNQPIGTFLVRDGTSKIGFVLSVKDASRVTRYLISYSEDSNCFIFAKESFKTIDSFIEYYRGKDSVCSLIVPAPKGHLIASRDFSAIKEDDLTVNRGDTLNFIIQKKERILCSDKYGHKGWVSAETFEPDLGTDQDSSDSMPYCRLITRISVPIRAKVRRQRSANSFAPFDLSVSKGDEVRIDCVHNDGICEVWHESQQCKGLVPINYLELISS